ncbi:MAG: hypothetical protein K0R57_2516 [Paenibacillaceae bacterium]|jgi:accessory gene regulator B|nr:hypothetical protein [Paenibacillaceae bacterium]
MTILSYKLAKMVKEANPEQTHSLAIMQYSIEILLNTLSIIIISSIMGWFIGELASTLIVLLSIMVLRLLSGGAHMPTMGGCIVVSVSLCVGIPLIPPVGNDIVWLMTAFSTLFVLLFAPSPERNSNMPPMWVPYFKILSILVVCSNFAIESQIIGWAFLVQAITIIPWKGGS